MEKGYYVDVDITVCKRVYVRADSEEKAKDEALKMVKEAPYHYARAAESVISTEVGYVEEISADEENELE